jgi:hypothetical protein
VRFLSILCFVAVLPLASNAAAESLAVLDRRIEFEPPAGYCLLDRNDEFQAQIFDFFANLQRTSGAELLAIYSECSELAEIVAHRVDHFVHYGMLLVLPTKGGTIAAVPGYTRPRLFAELQQSMPKLSDDMAGTVEQVNRAVVDLGVALTELSQPTIIGTDENALYTATVSKLQSSEVSVTVATLSAYTCIAELPLINNLTAPGDEPAVFENLYALQSVMMADFVARNE